MGCRKLEIEHFFELKKFNIVDVSYNYRYYNPKIGRWDTTCHIFVTLSPKDPIQEKGGVNLYAMVENGVVNSWDWLGYTTVSIELISLTPFQIDIHYEDLPPCCEINTIQWKKDLNKGWTEDASPTNAPFYYDYDIASNKRLLNKNKKILHHADITSVETIFIVSVVEVCSIGDNKIATILDTKTWSSKPRNEWNFNPLNAHETNLKNIYEQMVQNSSNKVREVREYADDMSYTTKEHTVNIVKGL
jgi:RHS repeat-associated protein